MTNLEDLNPRYITGRNQLVDKHSEWDKIKIMKELKCERVGAWKSWSMNDLEYERFGVWKSKIIKFHNNT